MSFDPFVEEILGVAIENVSSRREIIKAARVKITLGAHHISKIDHEPLVYR